MNTDTIRPTTSYEFGDGKISVKTFGRNGGATDWSLVGLHSQNTVKIYERVYKALHAISDCERVLAVHPTSANAVICKSGDLRERIEGHRALQEHAELTRHKKPVTLFRGVRADGCDIPKGTAAFISSADCPTIIAWSDELCISAHAGRDSLLDRDHILSGTASRKYRSVVDAIMYRFGASGIHSSQICVFVVCGISAEHFRHPREHPHYGGYNELMLSYVRTKWCSGTFRPVSHKHTRDTLDLRLLIGAQFAEYGVPERHISFDQTCTYSDTERSGDYQWWSRRRATCEAPEDNGKQNGVLVTRYW